MKFSDLFEQIQYTIYKRTRKLPFPSNIKDINKYKDGFNISLKDNSEITVKGSKIFQLFLNNKDITIYPADSYNQKLLEQEFFKLTGINKFSDLYNYI